MASIEDPTVVEQGISRPPSVHSQGSSILTAPPDEVSQSLPPVISLTSNDEKAHSAFGRTPSASPPNVPQMANIPIMPPMLRRVSELSTSSNSSSFSGKVGSTFNPPQNELPVVQIIDQSGKEVIDPALRDDETPNSLNPALDSGPAGAGILSQKGEIPFPASTIHRTDSHTSFASSDGVQGGGGGENRGGLPPLPQNEDHAHAQAYGGPFPGLLNNNNNDNDNDKNMNNWSHLPHLRMFGDHTGTGGVDTQPSTQTNSPTSPSNLWPSSFDLNLNLNGSLTDLGSSAFNTPDQGLSENENENEAGAGFGSNTDLNEIKDEAGHSNSVEAGVPAPKKKSHARKQPEGHIKRARNAFILFRKHITDSNLIPPSVEVKHQNISVVAAKMWKEAPLEVRAKFNEQARIEKEEHARKYPGYRYQPVFRRTDIIRRRVRKDPAEDEKVDAVAAALIEGKSGNKLEEEIKEQIIQKGNESDVGSEGSSSSASRRRRDVGQLSKGAIRAQKAQARAKQMRQNLLGTNLLNMSLYNAATNRLATSSHHSAHQNAHAHAQAQAQQGYLPPGYPGVGPAGHYSMYPLEMDYMSSSSSSNSTNPTNSTIAYDIDGRPYQMLPPHPSNGSTMAGIDASGYQTEMYPPGIPQGGVLPSEGFEGFVGGPGGQGGQENEMYRLPPIDGMVPMPMSMPMNIPKEEYDWHSQAQAQAQAQQGDYWDQPPSIPIHGIHPHPEMGYDQDRHQQHGGTSTNANPDPEDYYNQAAYDMPNLTDTGSGLNVGPSGSSMGGEGVAIGGGGEAEQYRLPPLMELELTRETQYHTQAHSHSHGPADLIASQYVSENSALVSGSKSQNGERPNSEEPSREREKEGQQTPSNHVLFNERLFDGALGTAGLGVSSSTERNQTGVDAGDEVNKEDLGMFDQAMEQAGGIGDW
uniref:HMG box domain-containing protein n=1 Tax=Kwoniella dejecticola CBS 10117 TaxID=1296121 RepID=A0A1A5ZVD0_9TREE|nr:uncharacterized protein I303_07668 [Kwoniella dejecticola CBS 10117]OBR81758.1 hypothetical protein I303_07668 [Kwoniella dejecticola CBS 10117]